MIDIKVLDIVLHNTLNDWQQYKDNQEKVWFVIFHKMIRQTDLYEQCYLYMNRPFISEDEKEELKNLKIQYDKLYDEFKHIETYKEIKQKITEKNPTLLPRISELNKKLRNQERISITGHLDSVLWNVIHLDKKSELVDLFEETFEEYEESENRKSVS
jgi:hypothetical protein